ncbi:NHLP family bacteriocin export ABC transporter permease/ATPase subunit [Allostella humosa]|nr:NHLP family bacteriocin export ABC transporter permease/ATPase subunit [Stella humosa]
MPAVIASSGAPRVLTGRRALAVGPGEGLWRVVEGTVLVFAVAAPALHGEGEDSRAGDLRRHLLFTGAPGDVLPAINVPAARAGAATAFEILAFGAPRATVEPMAAADPAALDRWVGALSAAAARLVHPQPFADARVDAPGPANMRAGVRTGGPSGGVLWIEGAGAAAFLDVADCDARQPFPLAGAACLTTIAPTPEAYASTTAEVVADGRWRDGLARFHAALFDAYGTNLALALADEYNRARERTEREEDAVAESLATARAIFGDAGPKRSPAGDGDPLVRAVAVIATALGARPPVPDPLDDDLPTPERVERLVATSGLAQRAVTLRDGWWRRRTQATLATLDDGTPLALLPAGRNGMRAIFGDGRPGGRVGKALAARIDRRATALYPTLEARQLGARDLLAMALAGSGADARALLLLSLLAAILGAAPPVALGYLVEVAIPLGELRAVTVTAVVLLVAGAATALLEYARNLSLVRIETLAEASAQPALMDRVLRLPLAAFREMSAGEMTQRTLGVTAMRRLLARSAATGVVGGVFAAANLVVMAAASPALTLAALAVTGAAGVVVALAVAAVLTSQRMALAVNGVAAGISLQLLRAIDKIRVASAERSAFATFMGYYARERAHLARSRRAEAVVAVAAGVTPLAGVLAVFSLVALAGVSIGTGAFAVFLAAFVSFTLGLVVLARTSATVLAAVILFERLAPILAAAAEVPAGARHPGRLSGSVQVDRVSFSYAPDGPKVIDEVSLSVAPGEFVALVGPSGSGKSTLLRLMLGLARPTVGGVFYDGSDLSHLDIDAVRRQFGVVLQDGKLFPGPILDNVRTHARVDVDAVWRALRLAGMERDVRGMPMGLHTVISDGRSLSGGQRQRLLLARALVSRPRMLFLDEATSALDQTTQAEIAANIDRLDVTRIVVAHRLSTTRNADRILVMAKGRVVEEGTYESLMAEGTLFPALARRQLAGVGEADEG